MKISVCMATFNGDKYINEQIFSILNQLRKEDELIISDDGSSDSTVRILKGYNDKRIALFENNRSRSPVLNFNNAISHAKGDIIVLADQDDVWLENKIPVILDVFSRNERSKLTIVMDCVVVDSEKKVINESLFEYLKSGNGFIKNLLRNTYLGCNMAFSKTIKEQILPIPPNISMHDIWIGLMSELIGNVLFIPEKTILFRRHDANFTPKFNPLSTKIRWRLGLINAIIKRLFYLKLIKNIVKY